METMRKDLVVVDVCGDGENAPAALLYDPELEAFLRRSEPRPPARPEPERRPARDPYGLD